MAFKKDSKKGEKMNLENRINQAQSRVKAILKRRGKDYGDFKALSAFVMEFVRNNISIIDYISTQDREYNAACVAIIMLGVKLARLENTPEHDDSLLDFFGYLELLKSLNVKFVKNKLTLKPNTKASSQHKALISHINKELECKNI